jgi:hypothetical protein
MLPKLLLFYPCFFGRLDDDVDDFEDDFELDMDIEEEMDTERDALPVEDMTDVSLSDTKIV